jgi:hypothetical protein
MYASGPFMTADCHAIATSEMPHVLVSRSKTTGQPLTCVLNALNNYDALALESQTTGQRNRITVIVRFDGEAGVICVDAESATAEETTLPFPSSPECWLAECNLILLRLRCISLGLFLSNRR